MTTETTDHTERTCVADQLRAQLQNRSVLLFITLASIGDAVIMTDAQGDVSFVNPAAEALTGWRLSEAVGLSIEAVFRLVEEATGAPVENPVRLALERISKVRLPADTLLIRKDESRVPVDDSVSPILGDQEELLGAMLVFRDMTESKNAERVIKYRSELDRMLARISRAFITSPAMEVDKRIDDALRDIGQFVGADRAYVFLYDRDESVMTCTNEWSADGINPILGIVIPTSTVPFWTRRILNRHHIRVSAPQATAGEAASERATWEQREVKSLLAAPMAQEDRVLGFIGIESVTATKEWPEEVVNMLYLVGNVFASALGRRDAQRRLEALREREVEIGSRIQQTLLLSSPPSATTDYEVAALTIPSQKIDGDFYDFLLYPNRSLDVIFGDVMGKGVPAALVSAGAKAEFLRTLSHLLVGSSRGNVPRPADIVNGMHSVVTPQLLNLDSFVTLSYVRFTPQSRRITVVDCGNTRLLRCKWEDGSIEELSGFNMPLGFSPTEVYDQAEYDYKPGDVFLLYSDGVTEARNPDGEMFGVERLRALLASKYRLGAQLIIDTIREAVTGFVGSNVLADDLTCVCLKVSIGYTSEAAPSTGELLVMSNLGELSAVRAFLRGFCEERTSCGLRPNDLHKLELAVNEAASNIMRHAYRGRTDQRIWVRISLEEDELKVRLSHMGEAFRYRGPVAPPSLDEAKEGGWGLFIINRSVDKVNYGQDTEGRQYVEIIKRAHNLGGQQYEVAE